MSFESRGQRDQRDRELQCVISDLTEQAKGDHKRIAELEEDLLDAVSRGNKYQTAIEDAVYKHLHTSCPARIFMADLESNLEGE